ncbi:MAG: type II secretion system F family protein, partial [Planctomycetota bacterium]|nr:type II secretion system F family protein [Planctomycetota bacterium]
MYRSQRAEFYSTLAVLIGSAVPVCHALRVIEQKHVGTSLGWAALRIGDRIRRGGVTLAEALSERSDVFGTWEIDQVRAGEASGRLGEHLDVVARELRECKDRWAKGLRVAAIVFLVVHLVFFALFLPGWFQRGELSNWMFLMVGLDGAIVTGLCGYWWRRFFPNLARLGDRALGTVPFVGGWLRMGIKLRYWRFLVTLIDSGVAGSVAFVTARGVIEAPERRKQMDAEVRRWIVGEEPDSRDAMLEEPETVEERFDRGALSARLHSEIEELEKWRSRIFGWCIFWIPGSIYASSLILLVARIVPFFSGS